MIGNKVVLDTNVIIFASKQLIDVEKFVTSFDEYYVSIITYLEVYSYNFSNNKEKQLIDALFKSIEVVELNKTIAEMAIEIRRNKERKIKLPDAIILATAKFLKLPLLTDDWDDFEKIDKEVIISNVDFLKKEI
ncbi:type II toxin-antitoxin system VapC family toxin [Flavobacterium sp. N1736]|uniref:type II toxin-antitoxin system VapC family toxin n=1 Tax=Flavobacterium sp. N1736 TaxID=2986823 RepID=UPI0022244AB1|nr:type II toxin-antitoxin system VapC family toxin [Flavobacterium sp. N1736]